MKMKWMFLWSLVFLAAMTGCGKQEAEKEKQTTVIAVIPKGTIHEFWKTVHAGAQQAANELGVEIIWKGPLKEDDRESQIAVVENLITRGVSGIVLAPLDNTALRGPVNQAMSGGIPVVIFDSGLQGDNFVSYVATDNFKGGQLAGAHMAQLLVGKGKVAVLRYSEGSDSTTQRENGFIDALKATPGIDVISSNQYAGVTTESAITAAENLLTRYRQADGTLALDGLFCATEPTTLGILRALQNLGYAGKIRFIGFDASEKMIAALRDKQLDAFVVQNPRKIGYLGVKTLVQHLRHEPVPRRIDTGSTLVTMENLTQPEIQNLLQPVNPQE